MDISQATSYIATQKQAGVTDIDIAQALVRAGWPETEIQKAFAAYRESLNPKTGAKKQRKKRRGLSVALVVVFVLGLVGGGGAWAYASNYLDLTVIGLPPIPVRNLQAMFDQAEIDFANPAFDYEIEVNTSEESDEGLVTSQLQVGGSLDARSRAVWSASASFIVADPAQEAPLEFFAHFRVLPNPDIMYVQVPGGDLLTLFDIAAFKRTWLAIEIDAIDDSAEVFAGDAGDLPDVQEVATNMQQSLSQVVAELAAKESFSDIEILEDALVEGKSSHHYRIEINNDALQAAILGVLRGSAPADTPSELVDDLVFELESQLRTLTFSTIEVWLDAETSQLYRIRLPFEYRKAGTTDAMTGDFFLQFTNYGNPREVVRPTGEPLDVGLVIEYMNTSAFSLGGALPVNLGGAETSTLNFINQNKDYILDSDVLVDVYKGYRVQGESEFVGAMLTGMLEYAFAYFDDLGTFQGLCDDLDPNDKGVCRESENDFLYAFLSENLETGEMEYVCVSDSDSQLYQKKAPAGMMCIE